MPEGNKSIHTSREMRMRARELRKHATPAEKILWEQLRDRRLLGLKFRRQHPDAVLDFITEDCDLPSPTCGRRACPERSEGVGDEGSQ